MIGRFTTVDPKAESHYNYEPYNYTLNNPLIYTDPLGLDTLGINSTGRAHAGDQIEVSEGRYVTASTDDIVVTAKTGDGTSANQGGFDNSKTALDIGGGIYGVMEGLTSSQGQWLGKNGKYYSNSWGGNQYTGSRSGAFKAANQYKLAGKAVLGVSVVIGAAETFNGYQMDGGKFGYNAQSAAAQTVGSLAGGWAGAEAGASVGAAIGVWFGGVGAVPGSVIGGVVGGFFGGYYGAQAGGNFGQGVVNYYHGR